MDTVLVTGAAGFTGRYLTEALRRAPGMHVVGTNYRGDGADDSLGCDLTDFEQARRLVERIRPDLVVHLAGLTFVGHPEPLDFYRINVLGTDHLLRALAGLDAVPRKIVVAGSANVYGAAGKQVIPESTCPLPINHYAASKLAQENLSRTWFDRLPIIVTRPFNYTGRGQDEKFVIPKIVAHFRRRAPTIELGDIDVERDFSDVRDVAALYVALLSCDESSTVVNLCSGTAVSIREAIRHLERIAGYEIEVRQDPELLRRNEIPTLRGDTGRLEELAGHRERIPLSDTLEWMYSAG